MDTFEHFDQQERSWSHLEEHGPALAKEAAQILSEHPEAELGGLILEAGSPEYATLRTKIEQDTGQEVTPPVLAGVIPRDTWLKIAGEQGAEWVDENVPPFTRRLAILAATKDGHRLGSFPIPEIEKDQP